MKPELLYQLLKKNGFGPFVGVPCSILASLLKVVAKHNEELIATSEGEAIGIASGLYLSGRNPVVFMQNSGLGNAINPITSLNLVYNIPLLLVITLRGESGIKDAPQHAIMGKKTEQLLKVLGIKYKYLKNDIRQLKEDLKYLKKAMTEDSRPVAFILKKGILEKDIFMKKLNNNRGLNRQVVINEVVKSLNNNSIVITTTGMITREYYNCKNKPRTNFYMAGSMGCASAVGLGVAIEARKNKKVVIIDGDGAILMKMGNMATVGNVAPKNLLHIVIDNECHESTGAQATSSKTTALDKVAKSCGYLNIYKITSRRKIGEIIKRLLNTKGPSFVLIKTLGLAAPQTELSRPKELPEEIKKQFMKQIKR